MYQLGSPWTDFPDIWFWRLVWRSVEKFQSWLKSDKVSDTLQGLKYIHTVESRTKYFVDQQQCTWNPLLCFHGRTQQFFIFDSDMWINNKRECIVAFSLQHFQYLYIFKSYTHIYIAQQYTENALLLCHCKNVYTNTPQYYFVRKFPTSWILFLTSQVP